MIARVGGLILMGVTAGAIGVALTLAATGGGMRGANALPMTKLHCGAYDVVITPHDRESIGDASEAADHIAVAVCAPDANR